MANIEKNKIGIKQNKWGSIGEEGFETMDDLITEYDIFRVK